MPQLIEAPRKNHNADKLKSTEVTDGTSIRNAAMYSRMHRLPQHLFGNCNLLFGKGRQARRERSHPAIARLFPNLSNER
jgi:hypothetical protein